VRALNDADEEKAFPPTVALGLRENWRQFSLLALINAFVGGMVGIERTVVPLIGAEEFHIESATLITSFIISFGVVKALANLASGRLADTWGGNVFWYSAGSWASRCRSSSSPRPVGDG
jgi:hypothetical protein